MKILQSRNPNNSRGIDVSHYQTVSSWSKVKNSGIDFVYTKASQGIDGVDSSFRTHVAGARSVGLPVGAYHYLDAGDPVAAAAEAGHFAAVIAGLPLDLDPVLDVEDEANTPAAALAFLERFEAITGRRPMVYTYPSFIDERLGSALASYPLWYASYSNWTPADRGGWTEWTVLQYSESGYVPGIDGPVDLDEFNGRVEDVFNDLKQQIDSLSASVQAQAEQLQELKALSHMDCPEWAKEAVNAAVYAKIIDTPNDRSYDFYSNVVMEYREGIIKPAPQGFTCF